MSIKIRLARAGSKKRPSYRIVAADSRMPRDGRYLEKLGTYAPLLPKDSEARVKMDLERVQYWLGQGAQATDRVARMLEAAGLKTKATRANPNKGEPGKNAVERVASKAAKVAKAAEAAAAPAPAPAPIVADVVVEEVAAAVVVEEVVVEETAAVVVEEVAVEEVVAEPVADAAVADAAVVEEAIVETAAAEEAAADDSEK